MSRIETIGNATLYLGDCRDILPSLPKVDLVLTDPPYGIGFAAQPTRYQRMNGMQPAAWDNSAPDFIDEVCSVGDVSIIWGGNYFALPPSRGWLIWLKIGNAPSMADLEMAWTSMDMNARCFEKSVKSASLEKCLATLAHPSQKPIGLMEWCINLAKKTTSTVADPFMGSGTTGIACANLGKTFYGIEREPKYFDIACQRIENAYRQERLFA